MSTGSRMHAPQPAAGSAAGSPSHQVHRTAQPVRPGQRIVGAGALCPDHIFVDGPGALVGVLVGAHVEVNLELLEEVLYAQGVAEGAAPLGADPVPH